MGPSKRGEIVEVAWSRFDSRADFASARIARWQRRWVIHARPMRSREKVAHRPYRLTNNAVEGEVEFGA